MKLKARGYPGSWFARVNEELLPCVHKEWTEKWPLYIDPGVDGSNKKWTGFIDAIATGKKVILTFDRKDTPGRRGGYIAVWTVDDVKCDGNTLTFRFVSQVTELQ